MVGVDGQDVVSARRVDDAGVADIFDDAAAGICDPAVLVRDRRAFRRTGFDQNADLVGLQEIDHLLANFAVDLVGEHSR